MSPEPNQDSFLPLDKALAELARRNAPKLQRVTYPRLRDIMAIARRLGWFQPNPQGYPLMQASEVEKCILMAMDDNELERFGQHDPELVLPPKTELIEEGIIQVPDWDCEIPFQTYKTQIAPDRDTLSAKEKMAHGAHTK